MMGLENIRNLGLLKRRGAAIRIAALVDDYPESLERGLKEFEKHFPGDDSPRTFASADELVEGGREEVDAIVLVTPNFTHKGVLDTLFASPKPFHILCEKPMCTTVDDAEAVYLAAEAQKAVSRFWVAMEYRYMPPVARLLERLPEVGRIRFVSVREHRFPFLRKVRDWNRFSEATGGTLVEKCCHFWNLLMHVVPGKPSRVFASGGCDVNHLDEKYEGRTPDILDNAMVIVEFEGGVRAVHELCMFAEGAKNQEELVVVGEKGRLEVGIPEGIVRFGSREGGREGVEEEVVGVDEEVLEAGTHHGSTFFQHQHFLNACLDPSLPIQVDAKQGLWSVLVGVAAHKSIDTGLPIHIPDLLPPALRAEKDREEGEGEAGGGGGEM